MSQDAGTLYAGLSVARAIVGARATQLKAIDGCSCGGTHVLEAGEADVVLRLAALTEPLEITTDDGKRVVVPPLSVVLHGGAWRPGSTA